MIGIVTSPRIIVANEAGRVHKGVADRFSSSERPLDFDLFRWQCRTVLRTPPSQFLCYGGDMKGLLIIAGNGKTSRTQEGRRRGLVCSVVTRLPTSRTKSSMCLLVGRADFSLVGSIADHLAAEP